MLYSTRHYYNFDFLYLARLPLSLLRVFIYFFTFYFDCCCGAAFCIPHNFAFRSVNKDRIDNHLLYIFVHFHNKQWLSYIATSGMLIIVPIYLYSSWNARTIYPRDISLYPVQQAARGLSSLLNRCREEWPYIPSSTRENVCFKKNIPFSSIPLKTIQSLLIRFNPLCGDLIVHQES